MEVASLRHQDAHNLRLPVTLKTGLGRFSFVFRPVAFPETRPVLLLLNGVWNLPLHRIAGLLLRPREQNDSLLS